MKKIVILGHRGYIGPVFAQHIKALHSDVKLIGIDTNWFAGSEIKTFPTQLFDEESFGDVRKLGPEIFDGVSAVVHLAAVSNDPMGVSFEKPTDQINANAVVELAEAAKKSGVTRYVFASSCSMYGEGGDGYRSEIDELRPLTAYARSKVKAEQKLEPLSSESFKVTALRFATACGPSPMLRLDLVLNDFVATALNTGAIEVLSDGSPWRPLIDVRDMSRAIDWAIGRSGDDFVAVNVGSDEWTWQIGDLAKSVAKVLKGVEVSINTEAAPDKRSYKVDFSKFRQLAPDHQPICVIEDTVNEIVKNLEHVDFAGADVRASRFIRLNVLREKISKGELNQDLEMIA